MAAKRRATTETKKRRAPVLTVTLTPDEREAAQAMAEEHDTSLSRVIGAGVIALRASKAAGKHIAQAVDRAPIGRPRTES